MGVTLEDFVVFQSLRVHELSVLPKQVKASYSLHKKDGEIVSSELIYSYEEAVFQAKSWESVNMASMMVAQVAMNYGLFCEKIIFQGIYESVDQRFIMDMIENTSREIYVHKLLNPTEFLVPPFNQLKTERKKRFTYAQIEFVNEEFKHLQKSAEVYSPDENKYAILSSGGKDSLLSYGFLNEHFEAHPIYVNESGRHWFTAYNAYHYFKEKEPLTGKVWCNSDRVFNWMVKHMAFIKPNFQNIRSDQYPIRLWTVSVFLWGVLPLARKRNIKNIIIGNEYDTSLKMQHDGIRHYAGLYDQSKYFDNAHSRYYKKKAWGVFQFSLLRSLSELLILKILVKRYPELQAQQVSCHASHKEGERMLPCGNCEKCRRIVGMLKALDEDPQRCGYTADQIQQCLKALETKKVKQLGSDAQQLYYMLSQKGLISVGPENRKMLRENKEILGQRFDAEKSNMEDLPLYIRKPLMDMYSQYSQGAFNLSFREWLPYELGEEDLQIPYVLNKKENNEQ